MSMKSVCRALPLVLGLCVATASVANSPVAVETPYGAVTQPFKLHQVADTPVYYIVGKSGVPDAVNEGHTSNAGFVVTTEGVVVFDALGTPALGYRMLQRIREVTELPIKLIVVSHYHADHIYGLQAFKQHAGDPPVLAHRATLGYVGGTSGSQGEDAERRLAQRREALFPWVDENTYIVEPDRVFDEDKRFRIGGVDFELKYLGPAHAPGDAVMLVHNHGVLFGGDVLYGGRIPFLDSPETDVGKWLLGLDYIAGLKEQVRYIVPGHGELSDDAQQVVTTTRDYILYVQAAMAAAVEEMVPFDEAYAMTDWSRYENMPAFAASNRGNAYRIYLEEEARALSPP